MTDTEHRAAAKKFAIEWQGKGYEKGQSQPYWIDLLGNVLGVVEPIRFISFEDQVHLDHTSFIDGYIQATRVLIEQKGLGKDLKKPIKQSNGTFLTPFQQAKRYVTELPLSQHPRWIVTCNFEKFLVYDMEKPNGDPEEILLENLPKEYYRLKFLVDIGDEHIKQEMEASIQAGELVGLLYDAFMKEYKDPSNVYSLKSLNMLCVRIVFCLYAEDAGIFGSHGMFHDYMENAGAKNARRALIDLFKVLDIEEDKRDPYMDAELAAFPYVNGGLFSDENIEIPNFTSHILDLLLSKASEGFNWSTISPTIFGAVFESTLNPETRRSGGMHYTSIQNIHKVIDPLFLDELKGELTEIKGLGAERTRKQRLEAYQEKLSNLVFLDPACGSGNFLTETYISLRLLENDTIRALLDMRKGASRGQIIFGIEGDITPILVSISQFYGIEINDFAVTVAKTALWIAESQMMKKTEDVVHMNLDFLPLKSYANITEGNALRISWEEVVPKDRLSFIMGNPPFVGYSLQTPTQKSDILSVYLDEKGKSYQTAGKIDYVAGWYFKAAALMHGTLIRTALVSTNSITQGEQVAGVWQPLYDRFGIHIDFAHRTFRWDSEASIKAHVHCIIVGFSCTVRTAKRELYYGERMQFVDNINPYLLDAADIFIGSRKTPICNCPEMVYGNKPTDGGYLFIESDEYNDFTNKEPKAQKYIRRIYGATEYINNIDRYCLWLVGASPAELKSMPYVMERVAKVKEFRLSSTKKMTRDSASTPTLFQEIRQPSDSYIIIPRHSSEGRKYIPFGFVAPEIIVNDAVQIIPNASIYHFGILMSNVHMAWVRAICGRIKSDYRYSKDIVYNNFPWPTPTDDQRVAIEKSAQAILDARALYPDSSLADLYDEVAMPPELRRAHQQNDRAVMNAYGFTKEQNSESACVAALMDMYVELTKGK